MDALAELILFVVSALPVFLVGLYTYKKDKHKEPGKILVKLFLGGMGSCLLVVLTSLILGIIFPILSMDTDELNLFQLLINVFIGVALVEEACKWIIAYKISYNDRAFDELYDAVLYCVFVALGFAFFENLLYVYEGGVGTGLLRAILAVPGHACDGMVMGYYLGLAKACDVNRKKNLKTKNLILSVLVPTILHGIYDYCLFTESTIFMCMFVIFIICLYIYVIRKINKISSLNRKIKYKDNYCPNCGRVVDDNYCPICGRKNT